MPREPFFNESHVDAIRALLGEGLSYRAIALQYGVDKNTVMKFVRRSLPDLWVERGGEYIPPKPLKILVLDIETKPGVTYFWHTSEKFIRPEYVIEDTETMCFAAKWLGEPEIEFRSLNKDGRAKMIQRAHQLLTEADGVVTYNGDRFDVPHLNLEFLRSGMKPPAPAKQIDLLKTVRRRFRFTNNRLTRVAQTLGIGQKVEHEGFSLWKKCMAGDKDAWARMQEYNEGDVRLTEDLYLWLRPWIEGHPSYAAHYADDRCPNCGSEEFTQHNHYHTKTGTYPRFQCDHCGKWFRGVHRVFHAEITECAV